jgi:hypothetical protein
MGKKTTIVHSNNFYFNSSERTNLIFQAPFFLNLQRLLSPHGILNSEDLSKYNLEKLKEA